jgi:hypothetical protein
MNSLELNRQSFTLSLQQAMAQYLVASFNSLKELEGKINELENRIATSVSHIPVVEPVEAVVEIAKPTPTPAIANMVRRMEITTYNDTPLFWKKMRKSNEHQSVVLWKDGIITTTGGDVDDRNPLARFRNRACAIYRLRKAGWNVPESKNENGTPISPKFIIATIPSV